jgi:hypothetical protein
MRETRLAVARPGPEHAGEVLTVQRAAYVTEAQRYGALVLMERRHGTVGGRS